MTLASWARRRLWARDFILYKSHHISEISSDRRTCKPNQIYQYQHISVSFILTIKNNFIAKFGKRRMIFDVKFGGFLCRRACQNCQRNKLLSASFATWLIHLIDKLCYARMYSYYHRTFNLSISRWKSLQNAFFF